MSQYEESQSQSDFEITEIENYFRFLNEDDDDDDDDDLKNNTNDKAKHNNCDNFESMLIENSIGYKNLEEPSSNNDDDRNLITKVTTIDVNTTTKQRKNKKNGKKSQRRTHTVVKNNRKSKDIVEELWAEHDAIADQNLKENNHDSNAIGIMSLHNITIDYSLPLLNLFWLTLFPWIKIA